MLLVGNDLPNEGLELVVLEVPARLSLLLLLGQRVWSAGSTG